MLLKQCVEKYPDHFGDMFGASGGDAGGGDAGGDAVSGDAAGGGDAAAGAAPEVPADEVAAVVASKTEPAAESEVARP